MASALYNPDILRCIFFSCLPSHLNQSEHQAPPLNFSQVCRTWRNVTESTGTLWADFVINSDPDRLNHLNVELLSKKISFWLKKSSQAPLKLQCDFNGPEYPYSKSIIDHSKAQMLLGTIFRHQARFQRVRVSFAYDSQLFDPALYSKLSVKPSNLLLDLTLELYVPSFNFSDPNIVLDLTDALNIRSLKIGGAVNLVPPEVQLSKLCSFELHYTECMDPVALLTFLTSASSLETLKLTFPSDMLPSLMSHGGISKLERNTLPNILSFEIHSDGFWSLGAPYFLDRLLLPSLRALTANYSAGNQPILSSLASLIEESQMPLKMLHVSHSRHSRLQIEGDEFLVMLKQCSSLEFLYLQDVRWIPPSADTSTISPGESRGAYLFPALHTLCIQQSILEVGEERPLINFIISHSQHYALRRFFLDVTNESDHWLNNMLVKLNDEGHDLYIKRCEEDAIEDAKSRFLKSFISISGS